MTPFDRVQIPPLRLTIAVIVVTFSLVVASAPASARAIDVIEGGMPEAMYRASAVWTGEKVYIFGGNTQGAILDTIIEYDPATGEATTTQWHLPSARMITSAVWTGEEAYIIGGTGYDNEPFPEVVRFVPGEGVTVFEDALPWGTVGVGSVWDGQYIYVLGNSLSTTMGQADVLRYDPATNQTTVLEDQLPIPGAGTSVVWTGEAAYIFGGKVNKTTLSDKIVKYVPGEGSSVVASPLPSARFHVTAAWDGEVAYIIGGSASGPGPAGGLITEEVDEIVVFDPDSGTVETHEATLPHPMDARPAVWAQGRVHVFGGHTKETPVSDIIVFDPEGKVDGDGPDYSNANLILIGVTVGLVLIVMVVFATISRRGQ
jgi:hypothetical protein